MSGNFTYRGSFSLKSAVITAGKSISIVSRPESTSLVTVAVFSLIFISDANVACGRSQSAATFDQLDCYHYRWLVFLVKQS